MNRRTFFRNLVIGSAALPAVVKAASEPGLFTFRPVSDYRAASPSDMANLMSDHTRAMQAEIARHIANTNPYAGLVFATDARPFRFS